MNDKRDEVIDAATDCLVKRKMKNLNTKYFSVSTEEMADFAIQHALSREAELHDEITQLKADLATAKQGLEHYANAENWTHLGPDNSPGRHVLLYQPETGDGYDLAQQKLDKIGKE